MRTAPPVYLSGQLGRPVHSSDGVHIGQVVDLTVLYDIAHPIVHRLAVGPHPPSPTVAARGHLRR
jgi:hypothetical protein